MSAPTHPALDALRAILPYLPTESEMLDAASLNEGRADGFSLAAVKARNAIPALEALLAERDALRAALECIAHEPQGHADASHADVLRAVENIARAALAKGDA